MQVMGAFSYLKEFPIERILRDVKLSELYEGVNEIQRMISASGLAKSVTAAEWTTQSTV